MELELSRKLNLDSLIGLIKLISYNCRNPKLVNNGENGEDSQLQGNGGRQNNYLKNMAATQKEAAKRFAEYWRGKGYEKGQSQPFWLSLLREVYGVAEPERFISFEDQVHLDNTSFIDGYIDSTHVMIEQKSLGKDLEKTIRQSDGSYLTPYQQAKRYSMELSWSKRPRWIVTCNFESFLVYDMEHPGIAPQRILLEELPEEYWRL